MTGGSFDVDAWHVMERRDDALIEEEILHGHLSSAFVYSFDIQGQTVSGVSVVGARHLAAHYGGIRHRLVSSVRKRGALFVFTTYPAENVPMQVTSAVLPDLSDEDDFYACLAEVSDIKTGNTIQTERYENRFEYRRDGSQFERPNYQTISQSKAYRNGVLALLPQDVIIRWKQEVMKIGKNVTITTSVLDEKRAGVLRFAARQGLTVDRRSIDELTLDQISGLGDAARSEQIGAFVNAARALGLEVAQGEASSEEEAPSAPAAQTATAPQKVSTKTDKQPNSAAGPSAADSAESDNGGTTEHAEPKTATAAQQESKRQQVSFEV